MSDLAAELLRRQLAARQKLAGAEDIVATTADGGRVVRKNGKLSFVSPNYSTTDPDAIARIMEGATVKETVQSTTDQLTIDQNPVAARASEFVRGTPFIGSYTDDAVGLVSPQAGEAMRQTSEAMQREKPGQTAALNVAGAVTGAVPMAVAGAPALAASAPSSTAGRMAAGGLLGLIGSGIEGGVYGFGEGQGGERTQNAISQAQIGAAAGVFLGTTLPLAGPFIESLARRWKGEDISAISRAFEISREAAQVLKKAFQNNDEQAVANILRAGDEATLADAGRSGQALLDAAAQTGGEPLRIVDAAVSSRANRSLPALTGALDDVLGTPQGPRAAAREVSQRTAPLRTAAYDEAYNTAIDFAAPEGREIESLLSRISPQKLQAATDIANERLLWDGGAEQIMINIADDGSMSFRQMPGVRQLDALKKALNQLDQSNRDMFGRSTDGGMAGDQARAVRDATIRATGGEDGPYARAVRIGGDKIEMDQGLELGLNMLRDTNKTSREMVNEMLTDMSQDAREMVKKGVRSYIDETLGSVKMIASNPDAMESRQAMQALRLLTSDNAKTKLKALLGSTDFERLMPQLDKAIASQNMVASVAQNSKTAIRQSLQGEVSDLTSPGVAGRVARGQPIDATASLVQELMNTTPGADAARQEKIWADVARVLSERRGNRTAETALRYIEDAIAGSPLTEAQARLVANQVLLGTGVSGSRSSNLALAQ